MALQDNNLMLLDVNGNPRIIDTTNDTIAIAVDTDFAADVSVGGNLHVTGDIVSGGAMDMIVTDNFLDLNNGNAVADMAGGFTVNIMAASTQDMSGGTGVTFTAQNAGAEAYLNIDGVNPSTLSLAVGDIIEISGLVQEAGNNGLFVVNAIENLGGGYIKIEKANGSRTPFCQTNFEDGTEDAGVLAWDLALSVICVSDGTLNATVGTVPKGTFCTAYNLAATSTNLTYESAQAVSMQESYNVGSSITMIDTVAGGSGDIVIKTDDAGTRADFKLEMTAGNNLLSTSAAGITLGHAAVTGRIALDGAVSTDIVFAGVGARKIQQTSQDITLETVTAGAIAIDAAGDLLMESNGDKFALVGLTAQDDCSVEAQFNVDAIGKTLLLKASNAFAGRNAIVAIDSDGDIGLDAAGEVLIDAADTGVTSMVVQSSGGTATLSGQTHTIVKSITNDLTMTGNVNASLTSTTGNTDIDSTAGQVTSTAATGHRLISTTGGFEIDATAGGFSIDSAADASNVTATGGALTLSTVTSGNVNLTSAAEIVATAVGKVTLASSTADLDIDAQTSIAMNSVSATAITAGTDLTLQTTNGDALLKAFGAGKDATISSDASDVNITGALAVGITATGGAMLLDHNHAVSKMTLDTAGSDAAAAMELKATAGGITVTADKNLNLTSTTETVTITSTAKTVDVVGVTSSKFEVTGAAAVLTIDSSGVGGEVEIKADYAVGLDSFVEYIDANAGKGSGIKYTAAAGGITAGDVCYVLNNAGASEAGKADNGAATMPVGIAMTTATVGNTGLMHTVCGVPVLTTLAIADVDRGKFVFLGAAGVLTLTAPTASGTTVWRMGTIVDRNAGNAVVLWNPQYVSKRP